MELISILALILGSSGLVGAMVAFVKLRPERDNIVVATAQATLNMQASLLVQVKVELDETQRENEKLKKSIKELEAQVYKLQALVGELQIQVQGGPSVSR